MRSPASMSPTRLWSLVLLASLLLALGGRNEAVVHERLDTNSPFQSCLHHNPLMNGTHEMFRGMNVVWQIPPNPRGVIFFAHALNKQPFAFFDSTPKCKLCCALPEERLATLDALENGYAVIALKSVDDGWITWPLEASPDIENAVALLEWWTRKHHLEALPLVAWGQSIGGAFVTSLGATNRLPLRALVAMTTIDIIDQLHVATSSFPPIMFVHFAGNRYQEGLPSDEQVEAMIVSLAHSGSSASRIRLQPKPLHSLYLAEHIHCMTPNMSTQLFDQLRADELVDDENYLNSNPGRDDYAAFMYRSGALPFCTRRNELCLQLDVINELKRAFGVHAFSSDGNTEIFSWLHSTLGFDDEYVATQELSSGHSDV